MEKIAGDVELYARFNGSRSHIVIAVIAREGTLVEKAEILLGERKERWESIQANKLRSKG